MKINDQTQRNTLFSTDIPKLENIVILKAKDIARILQININQASSLFKRKSFPALVNCRR